MRRVLFVFTVLSIILISGCNQNGMDGKVIELQDEITALQTKMDGQNEKIVKQDKLLGEYDEQINDLSTMVTRIQNEIEMMRISEEITGSIVENISYFKTGLVENSDESGLMIRYADMIYEDGNQYNGLDFSNEVVEIPMDQGMPIFLLNRRGSLAPEKVNWNDIYDTNLNGLFLKFYYKDGKVVFIQEVYIP